MIFRGGGGSVMLGFIDSSSKLVLWFWWEWSRYLLWQGEMEDVGLRTGLGFWV